MYYIAISITNYIFYKGLERIGLTMNKDAELRETMTMPDPNFSIKVMPLTTRGVQDNCIYPHWHEEMELLYFTKGKAQIRCNNEEYTVEAGDLIVVNCNELHTGINLTSEVSYYCIILHPDILHSRGIDLCDSKFINPILENSILFRHFIRNDDGVTACIRELITEYNHRQQGYELAVKSALYGLFVLLMRHHVDTILTDSQVKQRMKNIQRFNKVIQYLDGHYDQDLTLEQVAKVAHMSKYHFCRLFKQMTGHPLSTYLNTLRAEKAEVLLLTTSLSISEVAFQVGFKDTSYFSRMFKKRTGFTPREKRQLSNLEQI